MFNLKYSMMKMLKITGLACLFLFTSVCYAQSNADAVAQAINSKTFSFRPTQMTSDSKEVRYSADNQLGSIDLSGYIFHLGINPDSIDIYLPSIPVYVKNVQMPNLGYNKFVSTKFKYSSNKAKNGVWNISIDCQDNPSAKPYRIRLAINKLGEVTTLVDRGYGEVIKLYGKLLDIETKS